jgi:hypothetical protein
MDANKHPSTGHGVAAEPDQIPVGLVVGFGVVLTAAAVGAALLMVVLFWHDDRSAQKRDEQLVSEAGLQRKGPGLPPLPRLQVYPVRHWTDFQSVERERLDSYGWLDRSSGAVHIPIDRAIELIAERGVAPLPAGPMAAPAPVATPGWKK